MWLFRAAGQRRPAHDWPLRITPLATRDSVAAQRGERRLNRRRSAEAMARADVGGQQCAAVLDDDGAQDGALRERQPLPQGLEYHLLFREQPFERTMQIVERRAP